MTAPASYEALVVANVISMLAASANFQTLVGAANATAAKGKIVESTGGTPTQAGAQGSAVATDGTTFAGVPPFAVVHGGALISGIGGIGEYDRSGVVEIELAITGAQAGETPPDHWRRLRNVIGLIRADCEATGGAYLATFSIDTELPPMPDDTGADRDAYVGFLLVSWSG